MPFLDWFIRPRTDLDAQLHEWRAADAKAHHEALQSPHGDSASLYETTIRLLKNANFPSYEEFARQTLIKFDDRCQELSISPPHDAIILQMMGTTAGIYVGEQLTDLPPNPARYGASVAAGFMRDNLLRQQQKAVNPAATLDALHNTLIASFLAVTKYLPPIARDGGIVEGVPTLPLYDLVPNVGQVIEAALEPFLKRNDLGLFRWINDNIKQTIERVAERSRSKRAIAPSEYDGSAQEIVEAYLGETPFERIFTAQIPFDIPVEDRGEHTAIIAGTGWGKTQLLQSIIADDLGYEDPPAIVVIDSTGAMVKRIQRLAVFNEHLRDRLLIIDPELDPVPALNPFDLSNPRFDAYDPGLQERMQGEVIDLFNYVFSTIKNPLSTRMETAFAFMVRLLLSIPGANIHTLLELLNDEPTKGDYDHAVFKHHIDKLDPTTRLFFTSQYYTGRDGGLREQIRARVFDILRVPAFDRMFSTYNKIDFFTELNRGTVILVNTSESLLKDGSATFGRYIIARVMAAAFERASIPPEERRQAFLIVDEAAPYFDESFEKLLNRVRQFGLGVCIAFQNLEQASEKLRSTIASSTAIKYAGGTGDTDARWLSREMRCKSEFIMNQKRDARPPQWTQFACYVRNFTDRAVSLTVPFFAIENMPKMTDEEHAQLLERNRIRVAAAHEPERQPALVPPSEPSHQESAVEALHKAYSDLAAAITRADWATVADLKDGTIPALEREVAGTAAPKPASPSPKLPPPRQETPPGARETKRDWC